MMVQLMHILVTGRASPRVAPIGSTSERKRFTNVWGTA
jgi:hypothetical protein